MPGPTADDGTRIEVSLPRPVVEVWASFRDPDLIRRWFGWEYGDAETGLDAEIRQAFVDGTVASEQDRTLHIGGHWFELEDAGTETIVRVTRVAPVDPSGVDWDAWYDDIDEGWLTFVQQLRFALARGLDVRRTVHLDGEASAGSPPFVADAIGLAAAAATAPGEPYRSIVAGETLVGTVWFRSPHQLGLTVDGWGPGLLVLAEAPNPPRPHGAASATLTTYGPDDPTREARWQALWSQHYRQADPGATAG